MPTSSPSLTPALVIVRLVMRILLLHDIHPATVAALPGLLKELKEKASAGPATEARRPAPRHALAVAALRSLPALLAARLAVPVIRWGADASSDVLRQRPRCTACGRKGAVLKHPDRFGQSGFCLEVVTLFRMRLCSASNSRFTSSRRRSNSARCSLSFRREKMPDTANTILPKYAPTTSVVAVLDGATKTLKASRASSVHPNITVNRFEKIANATGNKVAASAMPTGICDMSAVP